MKICSIIFISQKLSQKTLMLFLFFLLSGCSLTAPSPSIKHASYEDGISGTGLISEDKDDGIGGTGIIGTISGFGSVIVNGLMLEYDNQTLVNSNGRPANLTDLKIGHLIQGTAHRGKNNKLKINNIEILHEVNGAVQEINIEENYILVLGQKIKIISSDDKETDSLENISVGDLLNISGIRLEDESIIASRIDFSKNNGISHVRGFAKINGNNSIMIGELEIDISNASLLEEINTGKITFVSGKFIKNRLIADLVISKDILPFDNSINEMFIEIYIPEKTNMPILLSGLNIENLNLKDEIKTGYRVVVDAKLNENGTLYVNDIKPLPKRSTIIQLGSNHRPSKIRPPTMLRPERFERNNQPIRPETPRRPVRERPGSFRGPMS